MTANKKIFKGRFGWKELILCAALAFIVIIFVIVFTGNTATVKFVSVGGSFDSGEGANVYDYDYYTEDSTEATLKKYHEVLSKDYRISSVATLPELTRDGYNFDGWFLATVAEDGTVIYGEEFTKDSVKKLTKDTETTVYAKWSIQDENKVATKKQSILAALDITWKGMLGIFLVIAIIFVCIVGLNFATSKLAKKKASKSAETDTKPEDPTAE